MSQLTKTLEQRGLLRITEALTLAARQEHERGDHELSVWIYDRATECNARLREVERIQADPTDRYLDPDFTSCASVRPLTMVMGG